MADFFSGEVYRSAFEDKPTPKISYGMRFPETCAKHIKATFGASRVYIIASKSLSAKTDALKRLRAGLGDAVVGVRIGISHHTPISEVLEIITEIRSLDVQCLITLGAGSITDGAKLVRFALANDAYTADEVSTLWGGHSHNPIQRKNINPPTIPLICIPTSLSGGEYQSIAGATEAVSKAKRTFEPGVDPNLVIQDPELCATTPQWVWLSSGVRSIDHCVETLCSLQTNDKADLWARRGLQKLIPGLLQSKKAESGKDQLHARHTCQLGVVEAMCAVSNGVPLGASHAIGHQLGPLGVGHGETSCILLPAVCKFNARYGANNAQQKKLVDVLLQDSVVVDLVQAKGLDKQTVDLGDILDVVIRELGMPRTLQDVKVGKDKLPMLAANSLHDIWIKTNAVSITKEEQVMEILEMVAQ